nr:hypothetical protein GCM10020093_107390 [Planobispora longispora]
MPMEAAAFIMLQDQLDEILATLSEREQRIIQLRFGLADGHPGRWRRSAGSSA